MNVLVCIYCEGSQKYLSEKNPDCPKCGKKLKRIGQKSYTAFKGTQEKGKSSKYIRL